MTTEPVLAHLFDLGPSTMTQGRHYQAILTVADRSATFTYHSSGASPDFDLAELMGCLVADAQYAAGLSDPVALADDLHDFTPDARPSELLRQARSIISQTRSLLYLFDASPDDLPALAEAYAR